MNLNSRFFKGRRQRWLVIVAVITGLLLFCMAVAVLYRQDLAAERTGDDVEAQFRIIPVMPLAVPIQHNSLHDTRRVIVNTAYKTGHSYEEIKAYYDRELPSLGWRFRREAALEYDGRDNGGREFYYCKGNYTAYLQYAGGQEAEFGWTYSFGLTWGLSSECK